MTHGAQEKPCATIQHLFMIKVLQKLGIKAKFLNWLEKTYEKFTA